MHESEKQVMVVGPVGSGKSTLLRKMRLAEGEIKKTEAMIYLDHAIDTPGEMISMPRFFNALILNSVKAKIILFLMDAGRPSHLPARMALALKAPVIGVVNKIDISSEENIKKSAQFLKMAGVDEIFYISSITGEGLDKLCQRIHIGENDGVC